MLKADSRVIPAVKLDRSRTVLVDTHSLSLACRALERNTVPSSVGDYESRALASIIQTVVLYDTVAHAPSAVELISSLPIHWKDVALHQVIRFLFQKLPPGEPYENPEKHYNVEFTTALDICSLLMEVDSDAQLYSHIESLVESAIWKHNETPFTYEQRNDLAQRLEDLIAKKLPNQRFIRHAGYPIIARAQVLRLSRKNQDWDEIIRQAHAIPNVSDQVYVLAVIARVLPSDRRSQKLDLLREAHKLADSIPSLGDKLDRYQILANYAAELDKTLAKDFLQDAVKCLRKSTDEEDDEPIEKKLVDLAYRVDPDSASSVASSLTDVLATLGDNTSFADATSYLRTAKLACRTKRDFDVVGRLDKAVTLLRSAEEHDRKSWDLLMKGITGPSSEENDCSLKLELAIKKIRVETAAEKEYCQTVFKTAVEESKANRELQESYDKAAKSELTEGQKLIGQLRAEMQLPPLPEKPEKP